MKLLMEQWRGYLEEVDVDNFSKPLTTLEIDDQVQKMIEILRQAQDKGEHAGFSNVNGPLSYAHKLKGFDIEIFEYMKNGEDKKIYFLKEKDKYTFYFATKEMEIKPFPKGKQVTMIYNASSNIKAHEVYKHLLSNYPYPVIYSDKTQTLGGAKIWDSLKGDKDIEIKEITPPGESESVLMAKKKEKDDSPR